MLPLMLVIFMGCQKKATQNEDQKFSDTEETHAHNEGEERGESEESSEEVKAVHLSELKFNSLGIKVGALPTKSLSGVVKANGQLEVPPQYEATVTAILGGNVSSIKVIESEKVRKGQTLAYLSHPDLSQIQTNYIKTFSRMQFLEKEYERQKRLYEEKVGSGRTFQQTEADYQSIKAEVKGYESQLRQLNINTSKIRSGTIYEYVPVISPIDGYIEKVTIQMGQYVASQTPMFTIVDNEYIHADLMVFEKDIHKVKKGQKISFTLESVPRINLTGAIYSVGKQFEQNPKAVHVHAKIDNKEEFLIPRMYINGKIRTSETQITALPEDAIIEEGGKPFIFTAQKHLEDGEVEWELKPLEVRTGITEDGWVEIKLLEPLLENTQVVFNNAYYLISEMQKSETSHSH
ncbi:efflux RND transporter periplasmic adaptor subunit [Flavobacterium litorale]|uniref:Efflux RND transporter periplasmic adaptor subunit n=2 Tax=Flavobacterium litorale TaxID=2856519 RepID=A0ABX8V9E4_9FLAO|nr:efflux RND transporter periplasmic adaptor subunit [Flavobacterium litorale]